MGKDKLMYRQKYNKMQIEDIAHDLWERHTVDLSTSGQGDKVDEKKFKAALKSQYMNALRDGKDINDAKRDAVKAYDRSPAYRDKADRYNQFKTYDLFGGDRLKGADLQKRLRDKRGRFEKYDPNKLLYSHSGIDNDGKKYEEYTYMPGNGILIHLREYNSPNEWHVFQIVKDKKTGEEIVI